MGCLSAPFKVLGCLGLLALLVLGWLFRDRVVREARGWLAGGASVAAGGQPVRGRPGTRALASAQAKIDSLNGWRADSVVLTPAEVASLMGSGLEPSFRGEFDSLQVELLEDEVLVRARLRTRRLPKDLLGPLAAALGPTELVEVVGPLRVMAPGAGEWIVRSFKIHELPVPAPAVPRLIGRALGDPRRRTVPWKVPAGVRTIRVRPGTATLYGAPRP